MQSDKFNQKVQETPPGKKPHFKVKKLSAWVGWVKADIKVGDEFSYDEEAWAFTSLRTGKKFSLTLPSIEFVGYK